MKKTVKQQTYNKMYLITPMVYEKIKQHLDKSDLISLSNVNKPYFNPKIEFHGSNWNGNQPYNPTSNLPPPPPPTLTLPHVEHQVTQPLDESYDDFLREMSEMDWREFENFPPQATEIATQTDPVPQGTSISTQTEPVSHVSQMATQTDPIPQVTEMETDPPQLVEMATQTDPPKPKRKPNLQFSTVTQSSYIPQMPQLETTPVTQHSYIPNRPQLQTTPVVQQSYIPDVITPSVAIAPPVRKKIIPTVSVSTQTTSTEPKRKKPRKKTPKKIVPKETLITQSVQQQQQPVLRLTRELVPITGRELVPVQPRTVMPTIQRLPSGVTLSPELRQRYMQHHLHYGQPVFPQNRDPRSSAYIPRQPVNITRQEYPILPAQTREVGIPESTYYVETPEDEPPGQRERSKDEDVEIIPPHKLVKTTFKAKKKKKQFVPTQILNRTPGEESELYRQINLPQSKKLWPCFICGAMLSSKYNLERHQARERKKLDESGRLPTTDIPIEEGMQQFQSWVQLPAKRTSTDAKLKSQTYSKRTANEPQSSLTYSQWN